VEIGGAAVTPAGPKQRALLALLLLHPDEVVSVDRLIDGLWGEEPPATAASALRVHVAQLRKVLSGNGATRLATRSPGYVLEVDRDLVDVHRFERLHSEGNRALADGELSRAADAFRAALALWRGPALADLADAPFAPFVCMRLEESKLGCISGRIECSLGLGAGSELVPELESLVAEHPLHERFREQLMLALYRSGRQAEALEIYREARRRFASELGLEPGPELRRLERAILRQESTLGSPAGGAPVDGDGFEGAQRPVTVVAASVGAPEPERIGAELPRDLLRQLLDAVFELGGRIETFQEAGLVTCFGRPAVREDDPERAALLALELGARAGRLGLAPQVGVATGAAGTAFALAERLRQVAPAGRILVSAATHRLVRGSFDWVPVHPDLAGSAAEPLLAFELRGRLAAPQSVRRPGRRSAELRGRSAELSTLREALSAVRGGTGQLVLVGGDAGIGKSRLLAELRQAAGAEVRWLEGRCLASGTDTPYLPYVELLSQHFGWVPEDDADERERAIAASVLELSRLERLSSEHVEETVRFLARLLTPARVRADLAQELAPERIRNGTFAAVRDFLLALASEGPLAVALEDMHWADALSLDLTASLMSVLGEAGVLLICTARTQPVHRWRRLVTLGTQSCGRACRTIELSGLSEDDMGSLAAELVPASRLTPELERRLVAACQGNPFFLEEIAHTLPTDDAMLELPASVQAVILSRVDALIERQRDVLAAASVIGRLFPVRLLAEVAGDGDLERTLFDLEQLGLVFEDRVVPEEQYSFKHVLTQEAVYAGLSTARRRSLHDAVVASLLRLYADRLDEWYEQIAHHAERGSDRGRAAEYLVLAGEKSAAEFLVASAIDYYERARAALEASEAEPDLGRIDERLGDLLMPAGKHDEAARALERALAAAKPSPSASARLERKLAECNRVRRLPDDALAGLARARRLLARPSAAVMDGHELSEIELVGLSVHYFFSPEHELPGALAAAYDVVERYGSTTQRHRLSNWAARIGLRLEHGLPSEETLAAARSGLGLAEQAGDEAQVAASCLSVGMCLLFRWQLDEAETLLQRATALHERLADATGQCRCLAYSTLAARRRGLLDETHARARRTLELSERLRMHEYAAQAHGNLAWAARRAGDEATARREAGAGFSLWRRHCSAVYVPYEWIVGWPLIGIDLDAGRTSRALNRARRLLQPPHQPVPADLGNAIEAAYGGDATPAALVSLAERYGYL